MLTRLHDCFIIFPDHQNLCTTANGPCTFLSFFELLETRPRHPIFHFSNTRHPRAQPKMRTTLALLSIPLFLAELSSLVAATAIDCKQVVVDGRKFDLSSLDSVHQVYSLDKTEPPSISNTTWSVNICKKLPRDKKLGQDQCKDGTTSE